MSDTEQIKPCPNPACGGDDMELREWPGCWSTYCVLCGYCLEANTEEGVLEMHNALPRREEVHAELVRLHGIANGMSKSDDDPVKFAALAEMQIQISHVIIKYGPSIKGEGK